MNSDRARGLYYIVNLSLFQLVHDALAIFRMTYAVTFDYGMKRNLKHTGGGRIAQKMFSKCKCQLSTQ